MKVEPLGFCDTNIFVDFSLISKFQEFINTFKRLNIADAVFDELKDWSRENYDYSFVFDNLERQFKEETCILIKESHFQPLQKQIIKRRLESVNKLLNDIDQERKKHLNKGEIVSAVYAEVIGAPFIQSNDNFPGELKRTEFGNIKFYNRMDILKRICVSIKESQHFNDRINRERRKMDKSFRNSKEIEKSTLPVKSDIIKSLLELKDNLSN